MLLNSSFPIVLGLIGAFLASPVRAAKSQVLDGPLTLELALDIALRENPELAALSLERRARVSEVLQAKLPSNPEIEVEVENLAGRGEYGRSQELEITARVRQILEFGTRRSRIRLAEAEKQLAGMDFDSKRFDVLSEVGKAFVEVLAAQERVKQLRGILEMAAQTKEVADQKVQAGKVSPLDALKAGATLSMTQAELGRSETDLNIARKYLAKACGRASFDSTLVEGSLEIMSPVPKWEDVAASIGKNPDLVRLELEKKRQESVLKLEKSARIPPLSVAGGVRQSPHQEGNALTAEISMPLPAWNWNQGSVRAARLRVERAAMDGQAVALELSTRLFEAYGRLSASAREITLLKNDVLPSIEAAYAAAEEGYRAGKYGGLEVMDARRTLSEARRQYLDALTNYHVSRLDVDRLIAYSQTDNSVKPK